MNARRRPKATRSPEPISAELAAWTELVVADGDLERMLTRLAAARAALVLPARGKRRAEPAPGAELDTALGCLAEHLQPAREAVRRFEDGFFPGERAERAAAWARRLREQQTAGHEHFRNFLAQAHSEMLPALRHLLGCSLCQQLARIVLFGFLPGPLPSSRRRRRRRQARPRGDGG